MCGRLLVIMMMMIEMARKANSADVDGAAGSGDAIDAKQRSAALRYTFM